MGTSRAYIRDIGSAVVCDTREQLKRTPIQTSVGLGMLGNHARGDNVAADVLEDHVRSIGRARDREQSMSLTR